MECLLRYRCPIGRTNLGSRWVLHREGINPFAGPHLTTPEPRKHSCSCTAVHRSGPEFVEEKKTPATVVKQHQSTGIQTVEVGKWNSDALFDRELEAEPFWEQLSLTFRVVYALGLYGGLAFAGQLICKLIGIDCWGGLEFSPDVLLSGLGYAVAPMLALLFLQDDEIVKIWPPARAVRDVEDGELMEYFEGMGWQFFPIVVAGAVSEELFFRVAIQGGLTHAIQASASLSETPTGLASLTAVVPSFAPFAQVLSVILASVLTGSMYYVITAPKDPTYVIAPVARGRKALKDMKKRFIAWNERRQLRKIYSPLMESLLALYMGTEWLQTGNILAPMITHLVYSNVIIGNGLLRLHYQRVKLRQRVASVCKREPEV